MKEKIEKGRKTGAKVLDAILCRSGSRQSPLSSEGGGGSSTSTSPAETPTTSTSSNNSSKSEETQTSTRSDDRVRAFSCPYQFVGLHKCCWLPFATDRPTVDYRTIIISKLNDRPRAVVIKG